MPDLGSLGVSGLVLLDLITKQRIRHLEKSNYRAGKDYLGAKPYNILQGATRNHL